MRLVLLLIGFLIVIGIANEFGGSSSGTWTAVGGALVYGIYSLTKPSRAKNSEPGNDA